MRTLMIAALVALPAMWVVVLVVLLRNNVPATMAALSFSDRLNIALFGFTVVSALGAVAGVWIGLASYRYAVRVGQDQLTSGEQQQKTLESQTAALNAARAALEEMVAVSRNSKEMLDAQLELAREQRAEEAARVARRPKLEVDFGSASWSTIQTTLKQHGRFELTRGADNTFRVNLVIRNVGNVTLVRPVILLLTSPATVTLETTQFAGPGMQDMVQFSVARRGYRFDVVMHAPDDEARECELTIEVYGTNMSGQTLRLPLLLGKGTAPQN